MALEYIPDEALPHSIEMEQATLGAMLISSEAIVEACKHVQQDSFYREAHGPIFLAITDLFRKNEPIDLLSVQDRLKQMGSLEECGGVGYIVQLMNKVAAAVNVKYYAPAVAECHTRRKIILAAQRAIAWAYSKDEKIDAVVSNAQALIAGAVKEAGFGAEMVDMPELMEEAAVDYEGILLHKNVHQVRTGFEDIDYLIGYLDETSVTVVAARPGKGKTSMAMQIGTYAARNYGHVAVFSMEMSRLQLARRMVCCEARVDANRWKAGTMDPQDLSRITKTMKEIKGLPMSVLCGASCTVANISDQCKQLLPKGLKLIIIDYIGLMKSDNKKAPKHERIKEMTAELKSLAQEIKVPILILAQQNRGANGKPDLENLAESDGIGQDADNVIFLWDEGKEGGDSKWKLITAIVAKCRSGSSGDVDLGFQGVYTRFDTVTKAGNYGSYEESNV